jgi:predicted O-methyltransferase YrrM
MKHRDEFPGLFNRLGYRIGVEIGTQRGLFAEHLLRGCPQLYLYCVDIWKQQPRDDYNDVANVADVHQQGYYEEAIKKLTQFPNRWHVIRDWSVNAATTFDDLLFDFAYIDANHSYKCTMEDLEAWYPKVRPGGMVCGHDYLDSGTNFGVYSAVRDFTKDKNVKVRSTREAWPSWYFAKGG